MVHTGPTTWHCSCLLLFYSSFGTFFFDKLLFGTFLFWSFLEYSSLQYNSLWYFCVLPLLGPFLWYFSFEAHFFTCFCYISYGLFFGTFLFLCNWQLTTSRPKQCFETDKGVDKISPNLNFSQQSAPQKWKWHTENPFRSIF